MTPSPIAVVTGASHGLGEAFARELAGRGYNLILVSLPQEGLEQVARKLEEEFGIWTRTFETDLTSFDNITRLGEEINAAYPVDVLINNAGTGGGRFFAEVESEYLDNLIQLNVRAPVLLVHKLLPSLRKESPSYVLNVASMAAMSPIPYKTVYPSSKAFLYNFTRCLDKEFEDSNLHFAVVNPGPMKTNEDVCQRIESQSNFVKKSILPVDQVARISIEKMLRKKCVITLDPYHKFQTLLLKWFPERMKINILGKIARHEVQTHPKHGGIRHRG